LVEEDKVPSTGREPTLDEAARTPGVEVKEAYPDREDFVETAFSQVEVFEVRDKKLGPAGFDVRRVTFGRGLDHLRRTVYRCEMAAFEPLADERRRNPVPAPDLEHPVVRTKTQLMDDRFESLAHGFPSGR
jgi:hypothetical protein